MKNYVLPYFLGYATNWEGNLAFKNNSPFEETIEIDIFRYNDGVRVQRFYADIAAFQSYFIAWSDFQSIGALYANGNSGGMSVSIVCPDSVFFTAQYGCKDQAGTQGFSLLPQFENNKLIDFEMTSDSPPIKTITALEQFEQNGTIVFPFWRFAGQSSCRSLYHDAHLFIKAICRKMVYDFPDREARFPIIGDACCSDGTACPGHAGAHSTKQEVDFNYFTLKETNNTHYVPTGEAVQPLWYDGYSGESLLPGVFDAERNFLFMHYIRQAFPECFIIVWHKLVDEIYAFLSGKGLSSATINHLLDHVQPDDSFNRLHYLHMHLNLGSLESYNYNAGISDLERPW